jgi:patatin-like phospholipase/acyl hydrolase
MTKPFVILSLSGGGYRGLYTCSILEKIEAARGGVLLSKSVDLVVGTSIGGIIALGLANEISAKKMREAFESKGPKLFKCDGNGVGRRLKRTGATMRSLALSKFRPNILEEIVEEFLGTSTLNELKMPAAVASVCVNRGQSVVFRNYNCKTGVHAASDAALATSAAPTYFPPIGLKTTAMWTEA